MKENFVISIQVLLLNDLLRSHVIDQTIYNMAMKKIVVFTEHDTDNPTIDIANA